MYPKITWFLLKMSLLISVTARIDELIKNEHLNNPEAHNPPTWYTAPFI